MPLKLHCIFNQPAALPEVVKLVERTAHGLNSKKRSAKVEEVYKELRDQGYEIDAESVAFAYENVGGIIGRKNFSSTADIRRFGGAAIKQAIEIANKGGLQKARLGRQSINTAVASGIANTFSALNSRNDVDKSRLFSLQEMMKKAASSMLNREGVAKPVSKQTFAETLQQLFDAENIALTGKEAMKGKVISNFNNISEIWDAIKNDVATVSKGIKDKAERAKFDQMTEDIRNSNYDLLLSTPQADEMVKDILKKSGYVKTVNAPGGQKNVIDWNKALASQDTWRTDFANVLQSEGFDQSQVDRIINKLETNYTKSIEKQAENRLKAIGAKNGIKTPINRGALNRLMKLRNAGLFAPNNRQHLREAMGVDVPQDVADGVNEIIKDYERNTKNTGNISNVEAEEVVRAIRSLLEPLGKDVLDHTIDVVGDYMALRASSTISTLFNATQNVTSGINSSVLSTITAVARTKNPRLMLHFIQAWGRSLVDVAKGGVTIRDAKTVNALDQLQGRGGLSDRWTFDNANGFFGYVKASLNVLAQLTATAADAANGTVIYHASMVTAVKQVLQSRGMTGQQANKAVDDIIFGKDAATGKTNRQIWYNEAVKRLEDQEGVINRKSKAKRIADELIFHKLVTDYGLTIDEVKSMQSASLKQKSKNLGHESDVMLSPSTLITGVTNTIQREAEKQKENGNAGRYHLLQLSNHVFRAVNMFVGGKANWAILTLQNSPIGIALGVSDILINEASSVFKKQTPLYRQKLAVNDATKLGEQLAERKAIQGRFERGIYGSIIQYLLYAGVMAACDAGGDDDEKRNKKLKRIFDPMTHDPNTRRFLDKALPMMLSSELTYAYDKKSGLLDIKKLSKSFWLPQYDRSLGGFLEYGKDQIAGPTALERLNESIGYTSKIKNEAERTQKREELVSMYVAGLLQVPYTSWYNIETKEMKVISSGFTPDKKELGKQRKEWKQHTATLNGATDAFIKGLITPQIHDAIMGPTGKKPKK